ncbi:MAG: methylmalonyl Co-A mutase-associated GTPase MeaB [Acidimicrobiia bacterium]
MDPALLDAVASGDRKALARAITLVEAGESAGEISLDRSVVGVTGPPGAGKSTLISRLVEELRRSGETVAVLAVDPSSPITGGAMLGDRIRMQAHIDDDGVYVRSMATRGHLGGLARASADAACLMGLAGFDNVIVETVGVGQSEVEIMNVANHVVLVVGPSWGDDVQADKAGIVEIADLFVINKGDRPGVADVKRALMDVADARDAEILVTTASDGSGVPELLAAIKRLDET